MSWQYEDDANGGTFASDQGRAGGVGEDREVDLAESPSGTARARTAVGQRRGGLWRDLIQNVRWRTVRVNPVETGWSQIAVLMGSS